MVRLEGTETHILVNFIGEWEGRRADPRTVNLGGMRLRTYQGDGRDNMHGFDTQDYWFNDIFVKPVDKKRLVPKMGKLELQLSGFPFRNEYPSDTAEAFKLPWRTPDFVGANSRLLASHMNELCDLLANRLKPLAFDMYLQLGDKRGHLTDPPYMVANILVAPYGERVWTYAINAPSGRLLYNPAFVEVELC